MSQIHQPMYQLFFSESQGCIFAINFHPCDGQSDLRIDLPKGTDLSREVVIALDTEVGFGNGLVHTLQPQEDKWRLV